MSEWVYVLEKVQGVSNIKLCDWQGYCDFSNFSKTKNSIVNIL